MSSLKQDNGAASTSTPLADGLLSQRRHASDDPTSGAADEHVPVRGLGGGILPKRRQSNQRQWDIANVIPVSEVKLMTRRHWKELFLLEYRDLPRDWRIDEGEERTPILGITQPHVTRQHRHRIVNWMSEACALFRWTTQTFFTAVHAWDAYMTCVVHSVPPGDLPKLSAACLYFGAELLESAADDGVKTLAEFTEMCPEAGTVDALRETQAHLVDTLQGISLARRTPTDFILLYLAQLQLAPPPGPQLFEALLTHDLLDVVWDLALYVSLAIYSNGLILDGMPGSRWVSNVILRVLEFVSPSLRTLGTPERALLLSTVFHCREADVLQTSASVDQILQRIWQHVNTFEASSRTLGASEPSYMIVRHHLPPGFTQWPIIQPSCRTVQRVSSILRACTPAPMMNEEGEAPVQRRGHSGLPPRMPRSPSSGEHLDADPAKCKP